MKLFLSYFNTEEPEAEDIKDHLQAAFGKDKIEIFMASSWESLAPGDAWEAKLVEAIESAAGLLVLMSVDALGRPWLNFEIGVAWAKKARILFLCHKGLTPVGLPRPYSSLQAVDLNGIGSDARLDKVAEAVAASFGLRRPEASPARPATVPAEPGSFNSTYRGWSLRPVGHIGETATAEFLVGTVSPSRTDRAKAADLQPGETLYIRLFLGQTTESSYVPAMVAGENARFFERVKRDTVRIRATLRIAAAFEEEDRITPLIVIDSYEIL